MAGDYLREIYGPLRDQALARVDLALRVAVMQRAGISRNEIAKRLDVTSREVRDAVDELRAIAPQLDLGDRPGSYGLTD